MTTPAPVIAQPDLEAWVWAQIGGLAGVTSFVYAAEQRYPGWLYVHHLQADARARRKQAARELAEQVRQIICGLPDVPWPDGVVATVDVPEGPFWLPDPDGLPRYCTRFEIRVHPSRASGILQAAPAAHPPRRSRAAASPAPRSSTP